MYKRRTNVYTTSSFVIFGIEEEEKPRVIRLWSASSIILVFGHVIYRPLYWRSDFQLAASQDAGFSARSSRFREDEATLMSSLSINVSTSTNGTISPSLKRWKICLRVFTLDRRLLTTTRREFQTCLFEKRENPPLWKLRVLTKGRILDKCNVP